MPRRMRVAFLTWRETTHPDGGGSEVFVEEVARRLVARGHVVTVVTASHADAPPRSDLDGVHMVRLGGRLTVYPRALLWLLRHRRRVDVVVDVINGLPFAAPLVRRRGVVALVHHVHQRQWRIIYPGLRGQFGWFVERRVTPLLYRRRPFLTVSQASRADLVAMGVDDALISVAPNGVSVTPSAAARSAQPRIAVLARLVPHKQVEHAVRVAVALSSEFPGLHLDVVGEGWWRPEIERSLREQRAGALVTLHGHLDEAARDDVLARAWVMLLPSVKEGWGLAVVEAAAQRTPTVAYRHAGGVTESILDGVTGLLADDEPGLVAATRRLLADGEAREAMGRRAADRAALLDWSTTTDEVESVLRGQFWSP